MLARTGLLVAAGPGWPSGYQIVPVVAEVARHGHRRGDAPKTAAVAATYYAQHGPALAAARAFRRSGHDRECARVLEEHGDAMLGAGLASAASELIAALPERLSTRRPQLLHGDATAAGHDSAIANAHVSLALCRGMAGDPAGSDEQYTLALRIAERTHDVVLLASILVNQTYHLLCEARYCEALDTASRALRCAVTAGHANLRSIAGCNEADALAMLGRYDEAVERYERVLSLCQRMGSRRLAAALFGLGEVHRRRGWREQARAAYEEATRVAEEGGNRQIGRTGPGRPGARTGARRSRGGRGPRRGSRTPSLRSRTPSLRRGHDPSAARAGLGCPAPRGLREAHAIWDDAGAVVDAARTLAALGQLTHAGTDDRLGALLAAERLAAAGVMTPAVTPAGGVSPGRPALSNVAIRALCRRPRRPHRPAARHPPARHPARAG